MKKWDIPAVILAAIFILWPLSVIPIKSEIYKYWPNEPQEKSENDSGDLFEILTIGIAAVNAGIIGFQAVIFHQQRRLMERQIGISADQYNASHRPRLRVRNFVIDLENWMPTSPGFTGQFTAVNIGDLPATIVASHVMAFSYRGPLPMRRPFERIANNNRFAPARFVAGASWPVPLSNADLIQDATFNDESAGQPGVAIMGFVDYLDGVGRRRRTAFCRTFDWGTSRFTRSDNEDYEHEE